MAYWSNRTGRKALNQSVPKVAHGTYDYTYRGWGNWSFNAGYAGAYGLEAKVSRFSSIEQVERWIDMGIPVVHSRGGQRILEQQLHRAAACGSAVKG